MQIFHDSKAAKEKLGPKNVVAIGNFDGVHFGHQEILSKAKNFAKSQKAGLCVLTFEPHPVKVLAPDVAPKLLQTTEQKLESLKECGVDAVVLQKFDDEFAKLTPSDFFKKHVHENLHAKAVFVGYDFTFGKKRTGTSETLEKLGQEHNIGIHIISAQIKKNVLVSSSLIRKLLQNGQVKEAKTYLTRPYVITGTVIPGFKRGTALGLHTANLDPKNEWLIADGVYATWVEHKKKYYPSVTNIGLNPTFDNMSRSIETHIFDFDENIYQQNLKIFFVEKLRDEIRFANSNALVQQIQKDIVQAKSILKGASDEAP